MRIQFIKILVEGFPKETLNALEAFSVRNVKHHLTDAHSQELRYVGMTKLSGEITFEIGIKGMNQCN